MAAETEILSKPKTVEEEHDDPKEQRMFDPKPREEMNQMVMEMMTTTTKKFWIWAIGLGLAVVVLLFGGWGYMIGTGMWVTGLRRPIYWGLFIVTFVFWIGISHAGTFISAILRVFKAEYRRPFTRAAELMTTFGLLPAPFSPHPGTRWVFIGWCRTKFPLFGPISITLLDFLASPTSCSQHDLFIPAAGA